MICNCGGILNVIRIEEPPKSLNKHKKLIYNRVCDVECMKCGKVYFSQPYDFGMESLNSVREIENDNNI